MLPIVELLLLCVALPPPPTRLPHHQHGTHAGEKGTKGSFEYLVYSNVLAGVAAQYGLKPVLDYGDPQLARMFQEVGRGKPVVGRQHVG